MSSRVFYVRCEIQERWVPDFLAMLQYMELLGNLGASRMVSFFADGDGDFRPHFRWDKDLPEPSKASKDDGRGNRTYDAG